MNVELRRVNQSVGRKFKEVVSEMGNIQNIVLLSQLCMCRV